MNQALFDYFAGNHGLTLTQSEMDDIECVVNAEIGAKIIRLANDVEKLHGIIREQAGKLGDAVVPVDGAVLIRRERMRQMRVEGWTAEHDDTHSLGQMAGAAACYALNACGFENPHIIEAKRPPVKGKVRIWPFAESYWKPAAAIRDLQKAGALIAAEIDRLLRIEAKAAVQLPGLGHSQVQLGNEAGDGNGTNRTYGTNGTEKTLHNPDGLTSEQVEVSGGWRLLFEEELIPDDYQYWDGLLKLWRASNAWVGRIANQRNASLRTQRDIACFQTVVKHAVNLLNSESYPPMAAKEEVQP